jgi:tryptophan synthase alpha chain
MIRETIVKINENAQKALSIYLTAGYPKVDSFVDLVCKVYDAGADIIELGIPFSDPLADGPVIQKSSETALANGVSLSSTLEMTARIKDGLRKSNYAIWN